MGDKGTNCVAIMETLEGRQFLSVDVPGAVVDEPPPEYATLNATEITAQKVETQLVMLAGKPVNTRRKPLYVKSQLNLGGYAPKPRGRVIVTVNGKEVGSGKVGKRFKLKVRDLPVGTHIAFAQYTGDDHTRPDTTPMYELVVMPKRTAFVRPYTAIEPTLRPPLNVNPQHPILTYTMPTLTIPPSYPYYSASSGDVGIRYTYNGDANLDGSIDANDYYRIDSGFLSRPSEPPNPQSDSDYDWGINADDYFLIDQLFLDPN